MGYFRFLLGLWAAKLSIPVLKITKHNGTNFPGVLALRICPNFLHYIGKPKKIIAVTGTNGKTTVSNMLCDALIAHGEKIVSNRAGSNLNTGISTALLMDATIFGRSRSPIGVFEVDERSSLRIYPYITPDFVVVTNLFRDSSMRNAHPAYIAQFLTDYIPKSSTLILNGDDLLVSNLAPENKRCYFGIQPPAPAEATYENLINDVQICPSCSHKLVYDYRRYHHVGKAHCPNCGFASPACDYTASQVNLSAMTTTITAGDKSIDFTLPSDNMVNIYNLVTVTAALCQLGFSLSDAAQTLAKVGIVESRTSKHPIGKGNLVLQMSKEKNPLANSRAFDYVANLEGDKQLFLMMNCLGDVDVWSENTAWLYDCDFELLNQPNIRKIVAAGPRARDYQLRLLLAGVPAERIVCEEDEFAATELLDRTAGDDVYVFYGVDSIGLAYRIRDKVLSLYKEDDNNEN